MDKPTAISAISAISATLKLYLLDNEGYKQYPYHTECILGEAGVSLGVPAEAAIRRLAELPGLNEFEGEVIALVIADLAGHFVYRFNVTPAKVLVERT